MEASNSFTASAAEISFIVLSFVGGSVFGFVVGCFGRRLDTMTLFLRAQFEHEILLLISESLYDGGLELGQNDSSFHAIYSIIRSQNMFPSPLPDRLLFFLVRGASSTKRI